MAEKENYVVLFQIGPVQEFITAARRTHDLWAGSYLLSFLCNTAMEEFQKRGGSVIFPLLSSASTSSATIPNRFFGQLPDKDPAKVMPEVEEAVRTKWKEIANEIRKKLERSGSLSTISSDQIWDSIWKRQIPEVFEIYYVWHSWNGNGGNYSRAYLQTEDLLGERKATRWFDNSGSEAGHKCSLCGNRQALVDSPSNKERRDVRKFWAEKIGGISEIKYNFRENEHLCAPCTVKRLIPEWYFKKLHHAPSASSVAVSGFLGQVLKNFTKDEDQELIERFADAVKNLAKKAGMPEEVDPLPHLEKISPNNPLNKIEGDWFYEETYDNLKVKAKKLNINNGEIEKTKDLLMKIKETLKTKQKDQYQPPSKYFCVLSVDADNVGRVLGSIGSSKEHESLSQLMAKFAVEKVFTEFQEKFLSYVIYFGGDDGLIFLALDDLFEVMKSLRDSWEQEIMNKLKTPIKPTLSVGGCIVHHQYSLRHAIQESREALKLAKSTPEKDSFAITILRRSGAPSTTKGKWKLKVNGGSINTLETLANLEKAYKKGSLSDRWLYDLMKEEEALREYEKRPTGTAVGATQFEIERLMRRHWAKSTPFDSNLVKNVQNLHSGLWGLPTMRNRERLEDFLSLMELTAYVARGGGR